ncbi:MAG: hypothetical protein ABI673_02590 [Novosphingobium sp.]
MTCAEHQQGRVETPAAVPSGLIIARPTSYGFLEAFAGHPVGEGEPGEPLAAGVGGVRGGRATENSGSAERGEGAIRSLRLYDRLPSGFLAFTVPDHSCDPLVRMGEIAVVDVDDRLPVAGALYLRRIISSNGRTRVCIIENVVQDVRLVDEDGGRSLQPCSILVSYNRPHSGEQWRAWSDRFGPIPFGDGPYQLDRPRARSALDSLVGRVVGILALRGAEQ